jgi:hypothetical protein
LTTVAPNAPTARHRDRRIPKPTLTALVAIALVVGACGARYLPSRQDPPPSGAPLAVDVAYGVEVYCPIPIELGGLWWSWDQPRGEWPQGMSDEPFPFSIWATVGTPYAVPGIITLTDADSAVFRADVDGSEFRLSAHHENPDPGTCL